jgi:hypothetical protein
MDLKKIISSGDVSLIQDAMLKLNLKLEGDRLVPADDQAKLMCKTQHEFFDRSQIIKKILLNSY